MATKAEARNQALQLLGVLRIGQSPQSQDSTELDTAYTEIFEYLKTLGLATWASTGTIPDEVVPHLVSLMAFSRADTYGVSDSRYQRIMARASFAEREIRRLVTPAYVSQDAPVGY